MECGPEAAEPWEDPPWALRPSPVFPRRHDRRAELVRAFQACPPTKPAIFLLSILAAGQGLTLTAASLAPLSASSAAIASSGATAAAAAAVFSLHSTHV